MALMNDREAFERALIRPPHAARMMEHAGRFVGMLDKDDKNALLEDATERLWETREKVLEGKDVLMVWIAALEYAARRRPTWRQTDTWGRTWTTKGSQLGRGA